MREIINQHDCFLLAKDLNPAISRGLEGVILEILDEDHYLVEFGKEDGTSHEFEGAWTFIIDRSFIGAITYRQEPNS